MHRNRSPLSRRGVAEKTHGDPRMVRGVPRTVDASYSNLGKRTLKGNIILEACCVDIATLSLLNCSLGVCLFENTRTMNRIAIWVQYYLTSLWQLGHHRINSSGIYSGISSGIAFRMTANEHAPTRNMWTVHWTILVILCCEQLSEYLINILLA